MKNPALTNAEHALKKALADQLMGLPEPVAADATICQAARDVMDVVRPFLIAEGLNAAAQEIKGNDNLSREIREHLTAKARYLTRRAVVVSRERDAA